MTANTDEHEQLRLIFLEQVGHLITDGTIETRSLKRAGMSFACGNLHAAFLAWQAARRAPVVPRGWKLVPNESTDAMARAFRADGKRARQRGATGEIEWRSRPKNMGQLETWEKATF